MAAASDYHGAMWRLVPVTIHGRLLHYTPFTRYNRLSDRLHNRSDNRLYHTGLTTGLTTVLNEQPLFVQPVVKPGSTTGLTTGCIHDTAGCHTSCQTGLTTGWMFVYTIQLVVKPLWQPVVSCIQTFNLLPFLPQPSQFILAWDRHRNMLDCVPSGLVTPWLGSVWLVTLR